MGKRARGVPSAPPVSETPPPLCDAATAALRALASTAAWAAPTSKRLRGALFPLLLFLQSRGVHYEDDDEASPPDEASAAAAVSAGEAEVLALASWYAAAGLQGGSSALAAPHAAPLRRALHPLVVAHIRGGGSGGSLSGRVSSAFRKGDFPLALALLNELAERGEPPKLGALQRWTRDCALAMEGGEGGRSEGAAVTAALSDDGPSRGGVAFGVAAGAASGDCAADGASVPASSPDIAARANLALLLLDAVLRVAAVREGGAAPSAQAQGAGGRGAGGQGALADTVAAGSPSPALPTATLTRHPLMRLDIGEVHDATSALAASCAANDDAPTATATRAAAAEALRKGSRVVLLVPGAERRPPCEQDLRVVMPAPGAMLWDSGEGVAAGAAHAVRRYAVPHVPGASLLAGVLSRRECDRLVALFEALGYAPDAVPGIDCVQVLADASLLAPLWARVAPALPQRAGGGALVGLNARLRCFRYAPGAVYRPHIDGSWPGSGLHPESGAFLEDAHEGRAVSRYTFLVYLNGGFAGGGTTFFTPGAVRGAIDAWAVEPAAGAVLIFPHGDAAGSLVHEGSALDAGVKYVIRSDILYERVAAPPLRRARG